MATHKQIDFIRQLCGKRIPIGGLCKWLGVDSLNELGNFDASDVIETLLDDDERAALREDVLNQDMERLSLEVRVGRKCDR